jgi:hypothetical protein
MTKNYNQVFCGLNVLSVVYKKSSNILKLKFFIRTHSCKSRLVDSFDTCGYLWILVDTSGYLWILVVTIEYSSYFRDLLILSGLFETHCLDLGLQSINLKIEEPQYFNYKCSDEWCFS